MALKKRATIIWGGIGVIGALFAAAWFGGLVFQTPEPRLPAKLPVRVFNITPQRPALRIEGLYYNPNGYAFTFKGGELDLWLDSFPLGHVRIDTSFEVPAHATFTVPVEVEPDFARLGASGIDLTDTVRIAFKGDMKGSVGIISQTLHMTYEGRHYLDLQVN